MQHKKARQREIDKRWDYTVGDHPIGYCHEWKDPDEWKVPMTESKKEEYRAHEEKYHTTGHATEEEACDCYKDYLLDHNLRAFKESQTMRPCQVCGLWTQTRVEINWTILTLCEMHASREEVAKLISVGESWESGTVTYKGR